MAEQTTTPEQTAPPEHTAPNDRWIPSVQALLLKYYPHFSPTLFADILAQHVRPTDHVLEIGAGSGRNHQHHFDLRGKVARYIGVDPDPSVLGNPFLDESYQASAESLPFANDTFDLVFHNYVAEHFRSPLECNREITRVLKPGGLLLFQTPNRFYYASLASQITPHWFHEFYVSRFGSGRSESEVFPTFYRLNDGNSIKKQLTACGFEPPQVEYHALPPGYLRFNRFAFLLGILYERTLERRFPHLRGKIIAIARKHATA